MRDVVGQVRKHVGNLGAIPSDDLADPISDRSYRRRGDVGVAGDRLRVEAHGHLNGLASLSAGREHRRYVVRWWGELLRSGIAIDYAHGGERTLAAVDPPGVLH